MNYTEYKAARDIVWQILAKEKVDALPVSVTQLCKQMGITVKLYSPTDGNSGTAQIVDGKAVIFVKRDDIPERQRFTAAHELGHIVLGHVGKYELINRGEPSDSDLPIEQAANVFASRLLAPACVLWGVGVKSAADIQKLCGLSATAAEYRWNRMQILYKRDKFLTSPLEREVYNQFKPFISDIVGRVRE